MKIGSLVKIKKSGDPKVVGTYGLIVRLIGGEHGFILIHRLVDGRKDSYHHTKLEFLV